MSKKNNKKKKRNISRKKPNNNVKCAISNNLKKTSVPNRTSNSAYDPAKIAPPQAGSMAYDAHKVHADSTTPESSVSSIENNDSEAPPNAGMPQDEVLKIRIRRWIIYGVVFSLLAVALAAGFDLMLGRKITQIQVDRLPDILLAAFAVAVNLRGLATDNERQFSDLKRFDYDHISLFIMLISIANYSAAYRVIEKINPDWLTWLIYVFIILIIVSTCIGISIERNSICSSSSAEGAVKKGTK